jgi:hypothetical protein
MSEDDRRRPSEPEITLVSSDRPYKKQRVSEVYCWRRRGTEMTQNPVVRTSKHEAGSWRGLATTSVASKSTIW